MPVMANTAQNIPRSFQKNKFNKENHSLTHIDKNLKKRELWTYLLLKFSAITKHRRAPMFPGPGGSLRIELLSSRNLRQDDIAAV